jgi:uncharacterized protein (DUF58 family)
MREKRRSAKPDQATELALTTPRLGRSGGLELVARRVLEGLYAGRHRSPFHGSSIDFAEHRPYQPGDELRAIDWRAYARTDRLLIKRHHDDRQLPLALMIDTSGSMAYGQPSKETQARLIAAAIGLLALDQGDSVRVIIGEKHTQAIGAAGALPLCTALTSTPSAGQFDVAHALSAAVQLLTQRMLVVVISDLLCDIEPLADAAAMALARGHDVAVLQLLDRTEISLPAEWGRVILDDPEGVVKTVSCDAAAAKASYDAEMAVHIEKCQTILQAAGIDVQQWCTDDHLVQCLGAWLERRRRR